jgi:hypothetical protein
MAEKKDEKQPTKEVSESQLSADLKKKMSELAFKNSQIKQIMDENASLKKQLGNRGRANRKQARGGSQIPGLARLGSTPEMPKGYSKKGR